MEQTFYIKNEEWEKNKDYCKEVIKKNPHILLEKKSKGGFKGTYLTWLIVWKWMKKTYPNFVFETKEIETNEKMNGWIKASLTINNQLLGTLALTMEAFETKTGEYHYETPEQLQMRIFVKLVANITGFGIHLWEK